DGTTGAVTSWNPGGTGTLIFSLAASGNTVYAGWLIVRPDGQGISHLVAIDATSGVLTSWDPHADGPVATIVAAGNTSYVGGGFGSIGGQPRAGLAAVDATTGLATDWNPAPIGPMTIGFGIPAIAVSGSHVYVGGYFTSIGGQPRNH